MYLMNVPPVVATEWRACVPPGGYSLPLCLNDSDSELSTRGTPIADKVQMIIESLRSTQSSVEMGDEKEGKVLSGQEGHPQVCKVAMGSFVGSKSSTEGPTENQQVHPSSTVSNESHDSDSDDSVDRGIEEAILEYLKEKDSPKQKGETCSSNPQASTIPLRNSPVPGISKPNSESNAFLTGSNDFPKTLPIEKPITPALFPIKKYIKHKALINESTLLKEEFNANASRNIELPIDHTKSPSKSVIDLKSFQNPVKLEEDTDSSSDDGIEEAIQKYQMEKDQQNKTETLNLHVFNEDSDSTSDDGIEEAIRCYQLEQLKERSVVKSLLDKNKPKPISKSSAKRRGTTMQNIKKHKPKKIKMEKDVLTVCMPSNTLLDCTKGKGNGLHSFKAEGAAPKANTTAELMCAEAILDISKTVIPGTFHHTLGLSSSSPVGSCTQSSLLSKLGDESGDSSIDSEDGIEQEIRRFLEQKAQMNNQALSSATTAEQHDKNEGETVKIKDVKKPARLSLTQRRKQKDENRSICDVPALSNVKDRLSKLTLPDSTPLLFSQACPMSTLKNTEQSGDKSSSLDSDEDLDTAIKDLLKTKKKLKKKTRDLKRKRCLKQEELRGCSSQSKKLRPSCVSKHSGLKKIQKSPAELKTLSNLSKQSISQQKCNISKEYIMKRTDIETSKGINLTISTQHKPETAFQIKEEDSSIDSDDSIELEIQKFLAEKAKVATAEQNKEKVESPNGNAPMCTQIKAEDVDQEYQLAEIPRKNIPPSGQSQSTENNSPKEKLPLLSSQCLTPENTISTTDVQSHLPSVQACSPSLLEPADGAGAARTGQRSLTTDSGNIQGASLSKGVQPFLSPNITPSQSASIKWRQSLGLPITDTKIRTSFHVTSSKINETSSGTRLYQSGVNFKVQTPASVWPSAKTNTPSFSCSTETIVNAGFQSHALTSLSSARQNQGMPFTQRLLLGHSSQCAIEEETKSMVHISKDKSVYVELESNRTNHVQVRSKDRREGKEREDLLTADDKERKSGKMEDKEVHLEIKEDRFIDETDYESGNESYREKKQGFSTL